MIKKKYSHHTIQDEQFKSYIWRQKPLQFPG